jgi:hypothetical protein
VQAHPGGNRSDAGRGCRLDKRELVEYDQLQHRPLGFWKSVHRGVETTRLGGGVDPRVYPCRILLVKQSATTQPLLPRPLAAPTAVFVGDEDPSDPEKPRLRRATSRPVAVG